MSIRVHELAKRAGISNKEMLEFLKAKNYPVRSVSSTVDSISAEAFEKELQALGGTATAVADQPDHGSTETEISTEGKTPEVEPVESSPKVPAANTEDVRPASPLPPVVSGETEVAPETPQEYVRPAVFSDERPDPVPGETAPEDESPKPEIVVAREPAPVTAAPSSEHSVTSPAPAPVVVTPAVNAPPAVPPIPPPLPRRTTPTAVSVAVVDPVSPDTRRPPSPPPARPTGPMVRSAEDVRREREEQEKAKRLNPAGPPPYRPVLQTGQKPPAPAAPPAGVRSGPAGAPPPVPAGAAPATTSRPPSVPPPPVVGGAPRRPQQQSAPPPARIPVVPVDLRPPSPQRPPNVPPPPVRATAPGVGVPPPAPAAARANVPSQPPAQPPAPPSVPAAPGSVSGAPAGQVPAEGDAPATGASAELRILQVKPPIVVKDFAMLLGVRHFKLISELMQLGIFASTSSTIDEPIAQKLAQQHGFLLEVKHRGEGQVPVPKKPEEPVDESKLLKPRPPVVVIMGHVDHGKTSILDAIRKTNVVSGEAGGITQHIGAYQVVHPGADGAEQRVTFLDTPGHAAFTKMRARGAGVGDIAVLVVAADDGFMPQTDEALKIARQAKAQGRLEIIACINKIDVRGANIDRVKQQLQERGLTPEDWGGETLVVKTSAIKGEGITDLLDAVLLQAEVMELKANPTAPASGVIIESQTQVGIGHTATVVVQRGTLKVGDSLLCGPFYTKVRTMLDERGKPLKTAGPSTPVRVPGWSGVPDVGQTFKAVKNEREARELAEEAEFELKKANNSITEKPASPSSAEELLRFISAAQKRTYKLLLKCDVFGSAEAIVAMLASIRSDKVGLEIVTAEVGLITKSDVLLASTSQAEIIGFQVRRENGVDALAKHHGVKISDFNIIYELFDGIKDRMADLLEPELRETKLGQAQVRAVFPISKGFVAGCLVTEGRVAKGAFARVWRKRQVVHSGKVETLRRVKDEVNEVRAGTECGVHLVEFDGYQVGDEIECFEVQKVRPAL